MENNYCYFCSSKNNYIQEKGENFFIFYSSDSFSTKALKIKFCPLCGRQLKMHIDRDCTKCKYGLYDEYWKDVACARNDCGSWDKWEPNK